VVMAWKPAFALCALLIRATQQTPDVLLSAGNDHVMYARLVKPFAGLSLAGRHIFPAQTDSLQSLGLTVLECSSQEKATLQSTMEADVPVDVDPCSGAATGTHVFVEEIHSSDYTEKSSRAPDSHELLQSVVDHAKNALRKMEDEAEREQYSTSTTDNLWSRAAPVGEWHAAKAFLPPAISFKMPAVVDTRRDRKEGVSNAQNLWAHHERLDLSSELGSAPDVLRGSKGASDWIRSVGLEDGGGCLVQVGSALHASLLGCEAVDQARASGDVAALSCSVSFEFSLFLAARSSCDAAAVAQQIRSSATDSLHVLGMERGGGRWQFVGENSPRYNLQPPKIYFGLQAVVQQREVLGAGFHRVIHTQVVLQDGTGKGAVQSAYQDCRIVLVDLLPHTAYVDPYQISELRRFGGNDTVLMSAEGVDVEAPSTSPKALQMVVVTSLLSPNTSPPSSLTDLITTPSRVSLPVHSRYQQPSLLSSFASVRVAPPMLLASCPPEGNSDATSDGWDWRAVRVRWADGWKGEGRAEERKEDVMEGMLLWKVPVGRQGDFMLVCAVTLTATVVGSTVALFFTLWPSPEARARAD